MTIKQCSKHVLQAYAPSNALYVRTYGRTNGEHYYLPHTTELTLRAHAHTADSLIGFGRSAS